MLHRRVRSRHLMSESGCLAANIVSTALHASAVSVGCRLLAEALCIPLEQPLYGAFCCLAADGTGGWRLVS